MGRAAAIVLPVLLVMASCADSRIATVRVFLNVRERGDLVSARSYMAPGARVWYEDRSGPGEPWELGGGRWAAWDTHFKSETTRSGWRADGDRVSAVATEINDYYRLTERGPQRHRETWFIDGQGRIAGFLVESMPGGPRGRLDEFLAWARRDEPDELDYLMPGGRLDPTGDRAPRFRAILNRWRAIAGLSPID